MKGFNYARLRARGSISLSPRPESSMKAAFNNVATVIGWLTIVLMLLGKLGVGTFVYYWGFGDVLIVRCEGCRDGAETEQPAMPAVEL